MANVPLIPEGLGRPSSPLVPGMKAGNTIYVSGQLPLGREGTLAGRGDVAVQTRQVLENVRAVVETGGGKVTDIVKVNVYLANMAHFEGMNAAYAAFFGEHRPARATVESRLAGPDFLVEMEAVAVLQE
ncbi:MAG: RidA family protein [Chloroflexi bacterium]|nr:RidA family protein [Chloroflexota bacterium]